LICGATVNGKLGKTFNYMPKNKQQPAPHTVDSSVTTWWVSTKVPKEQTTSIFSIEVSFPSQLLKQHIVAYLLKARSVEADKQPFLGNAHMQQ
jgi:hypothetical protein